MNVNIVIGANYGDEGKGLTSAWLAKQSEGPVLTVLYNGGVQRGHTVRYGVDNVVLHTVGAGNVLSNKNKTFYHKEFMVDPISIPLSEGVDVRHKNIIIDPDCRVVLPCDVIQNRQDEINRGDEKHGSCGMGIFKCWERSKTNPIYVKDLFSFDLYRKIKDFANTTDDIHNLDNFMKAIDFIKKHCEIKAFKEAIKDFDTINFEGGQGLKLSMDNIEDFPHLTPSYTGSNNIADDILKLGVIPNIYYVSRAYTTRHGAGPFPTECKKDDINPAIVDMTNQPNPWQDSIRYGKLNLKDMQRFIEKDLKAWFPHEVNANIVFTHLNYTDSMLKDISGDIRANDWKPVLKLKKWYSSDMENIRDTL